MRRCSRRPSRRPASSRVRPSRAPSSPSATKSRSSTSAPRARPRSRSTSCRDDDGALQVGVGDRIQATLTSTMGETGGLTLSRKLQRGAATARQLEDAYRSGLPVEGKVDRAVKAGYEVSIARQRAFCPMSQIDIIRHADPDVHVGRVYTFKIVEYHEGGRKFVVSRRALLEEEQKARAAEVRQNDRAGRRDDRPRGLGAGLRRVRRPWRRRAGSACTSPKWDGLASPMCRKVVTPGEEITVKVLRVDESTQQIALGLKQLTADPWSTVQANYEIGQVREGRVTRIADFGAFVELEPGIEALAHASTFPPTGKTGKAGGWSRSIAVGHDRRVRSPQRGSGEEADRRGDGGGGLVACERRDPVAIRDRPRRAFHRQGRASREVRRVRVPRAGRDRTSCRSARPASVPSRTCARPFPSAAISTSSSSRPTRPAAGFGSASRPSRPPRKRRKVREYTERERDAQSQQSLGSLADKLRGALGRSS